MSSMAKPATVLLTICLVVGLLLSVVNYLTRDAISRRNAKEAEMQRKEVLSSADSFTRLQSWEDKTGSADVIEEVYKGAASGKTCGFVFIAHPRGYGGEIKVTIGVTLDGRVSGVKMGDNKETPGLGSKASDPAFTDQFKGKMAGSKLEVVKGKPSSDNEVEAVSGATITSRAISSAVQAALDLANVLIKEEVSKN